MATRKIPTALSITLLGSAFLAGFLAMAVAGRGWWSAVRRGADVSLVAVTGGESTWRPGERGYVLLTVAMAAHPAWAELTELAAEVEREQQSLAVERSAEASITQQAGTPLGSGDGARQVTAAIDQAQRSGREEALSALEEVYTRRWEAEQARLLAEAQKKAAERRAVLAAQVDEQVGVKRGEVKAALSGRIDQIRREREARLLSLQLQLGLKDKDPAMAARADSLQEELRQVQSAIEQEIKAAQEGAEQELAAYARQAEEQARRDLRAYAAEQEAGTAREAEAIRQGLEAELARRLQEVRDRDLPPALPGSGPSVRPLTGGRSGNDSPDADSPTPLQLRRDALEARVMADVRRAAVLVGRQYGLGTPQLVATATERPAAGVDLTGAVVKALMR